MIKSETEKYDESTLLKAFNDRKNNAFSQVYSLYYKEFHYYVNYLYRDSNIDSGDIIQDIFLHLWQKKSIVFEELIKIKIFIFIAIKNGYKNHINHLKYKKKYRDDVELEMGLNYDLIECEVYSIVDDALKMLPKECAKVFKLYLEGWKPNDIAKELNKDIQTVYNKKQEAISILKKNITSNKLLIILVCFNIFNQN